ncbi:bifunctional metallophosphatase/5'-nucleotidase [Qipengyuania oceanensis]|uniref:Bifunctional metallophosphatase/5'-nucleotidase n=1 Tax=Qipengyuania oceanensis TaxID=1463597 RepID=A0A844YH88_9SPHN|nr:bifunctional metallophosphatase/5'-nucleotidase [Qipengyuania oceanensis]MXO63297.1 bifunctional metallophosphatase/5'-nucleotidase [Qipengyuania oceanensis]
MRFTLLAALSALSLGACATVPQADRSPTAATHTLRIVGLNDFHGNLQPIPRQFGVRLSETETVTVPVGGAAWLAGAVETVRAKGDDVLVISAGDLIGASPLVSSIFLDEPSIGAMNRIGLDFNAVGNHEFDNGWQELRRLQDGGCAKFTLREPCRVEQPFEGADFSFLAANVVTDEGRTLFPAYGTKTFGQGEDAVSVAIIGLTLEDTPNLVTPSGVAGLHFRDEAATINSLVPQIRERGIETIIVAIHQGLYSNLPYSEGGCEGISGPLLDILSQLDPAIDYVHSGHTHNQYVCDYATIDPTRHFIVTSGGYGGSYLTEAVLEIDRRTGDVVASSASNTVIQSEGKDRDGRPLPTDPRLGTIVPDAKIADYVARYVAAASDAANRPVGKLAGQAGKPGPATEETKLGNLIADGQLAATRSAGAVIALMNNTGIRADLTPAEDGSVTFGDIYAVQPFGNALVTKTFTGAQLIALLEQQVDDDGVVQTFSPSKGFAFAYDMTRPAGNRIVSASLDGTPIAPQARYRVTMNSFLAAGGDTFTVFKDGADAVTGPVDLDAFEAYLVAVPVRELPSLGRVTAID